MASCHELRLLVVNLLMGLRFTPAPYLQCVSAAVSSEFWGEPPFPLLSWVSVSLGCYFIFSWSVSQYLGLQCFHFMVFSLVMVFLLPFIFSFCSSIGTLRDREGKQAHWLFSLVHNIYVVAFLGKKLQTREKSH